jgi:hypothetical protein
MISLLLLLPSFPGIGKQDQRLGVCVSLSLSLSLSLRESFSLSFCGSGFFAFQMQP